MGNFFKKVKRHIFYRHGKYNPRQIWYHLRCRFWHRYYCVSPRYLSKYHWVDKDTVLVHTMFEVLCQFIEDECSPGIVDWEGSGHMINIDGEDVNVRAEMQFLYNWWVHTYNKAYEEVNDILYTKIEKHMPTRCWKQISKHVSEYHPKHKTKHDEAQYRIYMDAATKLENIKDKDSKEKMHRLVNISPYMWT